MTADGLIERCKSFIKGNENQLNMLTSAQMQLWNVAIYNLTAIEDLENAEKFANKALRFPNVLQLNLPNIGYHLSSSLSIFFAS